MTISHIEHRLDQLTLSLILPLRTEKRLVVEDLDALCALVATGRNDGLFDGLIDVKLAGKFWDVFCSMLAEADHAREPEPILDAAWRYQEELRRAFGPVL